MKKKLAKILALTLVSCLVITGCTPLGNMGGTMSDGDEPNVNPTEQATSENNNQGNGNQGNRNTEDNKGNGVIYFAEVGPNQNSDQGTESNKTEPIKTQTSKKPAAVSVTSKGITTGFNTLEEAWAVVNKNTSFESTVTLHANQKSASGKFGAYFTLTVEPRTAPLTVDLNGYTIDRNISASSNGSVFTLKNKSNVIIKNGTIKGGKNKTGGAIYLNNEAASLTLENVTITGNRAMGQGAGIYISSASKVSLTNCKIQSNSADSKGGGIYTSGNCSKLELNNVEITGNTCGDDGAGMYLCGNSGSVSLKDVTVTGNTSQNVAGGIHWDGSSSNSNLMTKLTLLGKVVISNNNASKGYNNLLINKATNGSDRLTADSLSEDSNIKLSFESEESGIFTKDLGAKASKLQGCFESDSEICYVMADNDMLKLARVTNYQEPVYKKVGDSTSDIAKWETRYVPEGSYTPVASGEKVSWGTGTYVVKGNVSLSGIECTGDVKLILTDGSTLTVNASQGPAIVTGNGSLTVFGEALGTGKLTAIGGTGAGIQGGNITVNGGTVEAIGNEGPGIGSLETCKNVTVNGGSLIATGGKNQCGIGVDEGTVSQIVFNGGCVKATGDGEGAGLGALNDSNLNNVYFNGGTVELYGGDKSAAISTYTNTNVRDIYMRATAYALIDGEVIFGGNEDYATKLLNHSVIAIYDKPDTVRYLDEKGTINKCEIYKTVTSDTTELTDGWWVVKGNVNCAGLTVNGSVKLILTDGSSLNTEGAAGKAGIAVSGSKNTLDIYGYKYNSGVLTATGGSGAAGIGGNANENGENITVHSCKVIATGNGDAAGIGAGGSTASGRNIAILDGTVIASGATAIGGGSANNITVSKALYIFPDKNNMSVDSVIANDGVDIAETLKNKNSLYITGDVAALDLPVTHHLKLTSNLLQLNTATDFVIKYSDLMSANVNSYNSTLANLAFMMCMDSHEIMCVSSQFCSNSSQSNLKAFPASLGFSETVKIDVRSSNGVDEDDSSTMVISRMEMPYEGETANFINVSIWGTMLAGEWNSDFDLGADTDVYYELTGEHPEWTDKANHKGFDVAANRVISELMTYLNERGLTGENAPRVRLCINGYSRGAAVGNLVASKFGTGSFVVGPNADCVAYNFATPRTTTDKDAKAGSYSYIYNFANDDDVIANLPMESAGFSRYGQDMAFDLDSSSDLCGQFNAITGFNYNTLGIAQMRAGLNSVANSREELYMIDESEDARVTSGTFADEASANAKVSELKLKFEKEVGSNWEKCVKIFNEKNEDGTYTVSFCTSAMTLGNMLGSLILVENLMDAQYITGYFACKKYESLMNSMYMLSSTGRTIIDFHLPASYFVYLKSLN